MDERSIVDRRISLEHLRTQLQNERSSFEDHWRDLSDYILPRRSRFFVSDSNKGDRRNLKIIDSTATLAARVLQAGMMSGMTSPARPWFQLGTHSPEFTEAEDVAMWLHTVTNRMRTGFLRSNLYKITPQVYEDAGVFATACTFVEKDMDNFLHFYDFPIGSYYITSDYSGRVNVFMRNFRMTVRQIVDTFGRTMEDNSKIDWSNISATVKTLYNDNNTEEWIEVVHAVLPNENHNPSMMDSRHKRFISIYYEQGVNSENNSSYVDSDINEKFLSEKGYNLFPVLCPRWSVAGEDVYGTNSPGMICLGDVKQLQHGEKKSLQAVDKTVNPPMNAPTSLKHGKASILPGDITYYDTMQGQQGFVPAYQVRFDHTGVEGKQEQCRDRINRSFFVDVFLGIINARQGQKTAREVDEIHEEKLLGMGPVLEQFKQDFYDPLIDIAFDNMIEQGLVPPPPKQLEGENLKVEYISIMANAQKMVGLGGIERFAGFVGGVASVDPSAIDKIDRDKLIDTYAEMSSIPPGIVVPDDEANAIRERRAEQQMQMMQLEKANMEAQTAKTLSDTDTQGPNALTSITAQEAEAEEALAA